MITTIKAKLPATYILYMGAKHGQAHSLTGRDTPDAS